MPNALSPRFAAGLLALFALCFPVAESAAQQGKMSIPDFTQGDTIPDSASHDWNLGATGARGWMFSDKLVTTDARQVFITEVAKGSPADGILQRGDVLLGVGGKRFAYDPRTEIGKALTKAESRAGGGKLALLRWREGKTQTVSLRLPVMGTYSDTAPYNCPKSKQILEQGCRALAERMADPAYRRNPMERSFNALALLASGDEQYLPLVKREAEWAAASTPGGYKSWWYGPVMILIAEYIQATGDRSVLPGLERLALEAAQGQSVVGSWGHRFVTETGLLGGYGMMNAPGVPLTIGLVLAREAGVDDPEVDLAIERSARLLRFYVGKGCIPYGDHDPWIQTHDDNGKNGMAAVLFNLLGDAEAADYFSRMSVASHSGERECGHTGNFFNITWAMPGVNLSGPRATGAWMDEFGGWYFDLARQWDGTFRHQGPPQMRSDRFRDWDSTGTTLLAYAMPLKQTRLTGKGGALLPPMSRTAASKLIRDGRGWDNKDRNSFYDKQSTTQLMGRLGNWSPVVRERAAMALGRRGVEVVPQLIKLLEGDALHARYGACQAIKHLRIDRATAVPALREALDDEDLWLRILAAQALAAIGEPARVAVPDLLERLAEKDVKNDPRAMEQRYLCFALFNRRGGLISRSLEGIDRDLLLQAVRAGLKNDDGRARGAIGSVYRNLTLEEIRPLLPAVYEAVVESSPSGIMFADGIRLEGMRVLARHHIEEGMRACIIYLDNQNGWGEQKRTPEVLKALVQYGGHAERVIPDLERIAKRYDAEDAKRRAGSRNGLGDRVREAIDAIKTSNDKPELIRIDLGEHVGEGPAVR